MFTCKNTTVTSDVKSFMSSIINFKCPLTGIKLIKLINSEVNLSGCEERETAGSFEKKLIPGPVLLMLFHKALHYCCIIKRLLVASSNVAECLCCEISKVRDSDVALMAMNDLLLLDICFNSLSKTF